jgi:tRNA dimethylallyltransferase
MKAKNNKVIIIAGPTASGKTALAIEIAKHYNTKIISADSRQCFKEMRIGVARPSTEELAVVHHYFIASHSIHQKVTAATFEEYALEKTNEVFKENDTVVMAGGTGLYIKAFCEGLDAVPEIPEDLRSQVIEGYTSKGLTWLQNEVAQKDPLFYNKGENKNPHRLMRALEVKLATGASILDFRKHKPVERDFDIIKIAIDLPKEKVYQNINHRVDKMMDEGLLHEVESLCAFQHLNALQTVGYKELFNHLKGDLALPDAMEEIKKNTRHYAKRQITWFKKDNSYKWLPPDAILSYVQTIK